MLIERNIDQKMKKERNVDRKENRQKKGIQKEMQVEGNPDGKK